MLLGDLDSPPEADAPADAEPRLLGPELGDLDSNQDKWIQSPLSYR